MGEHDQIWLLEDDEGVGLLTLQEWPDCEGCHIHFGGCNTFGQSEANLQALMDYTGTTSVSGYAAESNWLDWKAPAVLLELQLFWHLWAVDIASNDRDALQELRSIKRSITKRFPDCEFKMLVRRFNAN